MADDMNLAGTDAGQASVRPEIDKEELLTKCLRQFRDWEDNGRYERAMSERCRDYYDGVQLTAEEEQTLKERGQPIVISNRIKPKIDALIGFEKSSRTDPKAYARTPRQDSDADSATDALRFVTEQNQFDTIRSDVAENLFIEGCGGAVVGVKKRPNGNLDVSITPIPWDRFYRDIHSRMRDFSDASYLGVVLWMDEEDVLAQFPGSDDVIAGAYSSEQSGSETYDDRPRTVWCDQQKRRVRILQHRWKQQGVWYTGTLCKGGWLRDPQKSPYLDEWGLPECDIIATSAFVDRNNRRYGPTQTMLSPQDEINKRRAKSLHRLSVRTTISERGAVDNVSKARAELAKPDGYIEVRPGARFEILDNQSALAGEFQLLQESKAEIDASGVNPALEGDVKAPSGRAVQALQQAGLQEMAIPFDALKMWSWRVYRACWNRIRQYWTEEKWVRVTDDEDSIRWVGLNRPVTVAEEMTRYQQEGQPPPQSLIAMAQGNPNAIVRYENQVAEIDVDILVEDGPDTVTIQGEQFQQLVELKKADPSSIPTEMIIQASSLRNKDQILEKMQQQVPPQLQQQMAQMQQQLQQLQQQLQQKDQQLADNSLDTAKLMTDQFKAQTDRFEAETDRVRATAETAVPTVMQ
ncbi:hypothetical protein [Xanthomonas albilineans]|uniref:portal protein n=1 Tax=Xanthomonas albilineans TaxID=29447 RepID=UPI0005F34643|nr:hypothetical protein [Xanthomonas albilineans]